MLNHMKVASPSVATSLLFDVVVIAGGSAPGLNPLCNNEPKPMLSICNRPMIWYCLQPWIIVGCRIFFVCVNEDYAVLQSYLCREFPSVEFIFVLVHLTQNEMTTTTCDVLKAYLKHKESLKPEKFRQPRDALLLSCDTLLPGVNIEHFIRNFYSTVASVSVLLFKPISDTDQTTTSVQPPSHMGGQGGNKGRGEFAHPKPYKYRFTCAVYEEDENLSDKSSDAAMAGVHHHRLHFLCPYEDKPALRLSHGFTGRRPNLTFSADTMDAHAYLMRHWVLHCIAESTEEGLTLQRDCIPFLARSQHSTVNAEQDIFMRPDAKIKTNIPKHWMFDEDGASLPMLNAVQGPVLPAEADNLLVCCTIYEEQEDTMMRIYRVKTREDFLAVSHEILKAKCQQLGLDEALPERRQLQQKNARLGKRESFHPAVLPPRLLALANLLPDSPFSLREKIGTQQVQIKCSFLKSVPSGNAFITQSIIGSNVLLGENVRITNSVILGNVEIGADVVITNSVIGSSAAINPNVKVVNCTVGPQCLVEKDQTDSVVCAN